MSIYIYSTLLPLILYLFKNSFINRTLILLIFIYFLIFIGFRDYVGPDWYVLNSIQKNLSNSFSYKDLFSREPIELLLKYFSLKLGFNMNGVFFSYSFFSLLIYFYVFQKENFYNRNFLIFFSIPFIFLFLSINSPRQSFAISILFFLLMQNIYINKNILFDIFFLLLAILVHNSLVFVAPLVFLVRYDKEFKYSRSILIILLIIAPLLLFILPKIWFYFVNHYINVNMYSPAYYFRVIYFFPFISIGLFLLSVNNLNEKDKIIIIYFTLFYLFTFILSFLSTTTADRLNYFIFAYSLYLIIVIIKKFQKNKYINLFRSLLIFYNITFFLIWINYSIAFNSWLPYKNLIFE